MALQERPQRPEWLEDRLAHTDEIGTWYGELADMVNGLRRGEINPVVFDLQWFDSKEILDRRLQSRFGQYAQQVDDLTYSAHDSDLLPPGIDNAQREQILNEAFGKLESEISERNPGDPLITQHLRLERALAVQLGQSFEALRDPRVESVIPESVDGIEPFIKELNNPAIRKDWRDRIVKSLAYNSATDKAALITELYARLLVTFDPTTAQVVLDHAFKAYATQEEAQLAKATFNSRYIKIHQSRRFLAYLMAGEETTGAFIKRHLGIPADFQLNPVPHQSEK